MLSKRNGPPELESFFFFVFLWGRKWVSGACSQEFPQFWAVSLCHGSGVRKREKGKERGKREGKIEREDREGKIERER